MTPTGEVERSFGVWQRGGTAAPTPVAAGPRGHLFQLGEQTYTILEMTAQGDPVRRYLRDAMIEVLDPMAGRVVARATRPEAQVRFLPGTDLLYTARQDSTGYVYFDLWEPVIPDHAAGL